MPSGAAAARRIWCARKPASTKSQADSPVASCAALPYDRRSNPARIRVQAALRATRFAIALDGEVVVDKDRVVDPAMIVDPDRVSH